MRVVQGVFWIHWGYIGVMKKEEKRHASNQALGVYGLRITEGTLHRSPMA